MNQNENNTNPASTNPEENENIIFEKNGTFCRVGSDSSGILEVDLQSSKQRGTEVRCVSFAVIGFNEENQIIKSEMLLMDEQSFNKYKEFIAQLNWND